jgi:thioredoxin 1
MTDTVSVADDTFDAQVLKSELPVVVNFWATWCGPCTRFAPVLEEIAGEHGDRFTVVKVDIDASPKSADRYQVRGVPTTVLFQDGKEVLRVVGAKPKAALLDTLADHLG